MGVREGEAVGVSPAEIVQEALRVAEMMVPVGVGSGDTEGGEVSVGEREGEAVGVLPLE